MHADARVISNLLLALYQKAREVPVAEFPEIAMNLIQPFLQFRSGWFGGALTAGNGLDVRYAHLHREPIEMRTAYQEVGHLDKAIQKIRRRQSAIAVVHAPTLFGDREHAPMLDYTKRFGHMAIMIASRSSAESGFLEWVSLFRSDPDRQWNESERRLMSMLFPHFMEALALNRAVHHEWLGDQLHDEIPKLAIADLRGYILQVESDFAKWAEEEWPRDIRRHRLPDEVARQLVDGRAWRGHKFVILSRIVGVFMFLRIRRVTKADMLTVREWAIAERLERGLNYRDVAREIDVTPQTAKTYIKNLYEKLSVRNRAELCAVVHKMR